MSIADVIDRLDNLDSEMKRIKRLLEEIKRRTDQIYSSI